MKVGVATRNPLKIKAVKEVFGKVFSDVEIVSVSQESGVPDQPKGDEILKGAINRARNALKGNDFGVGIEAGTIEINGRLCDIGYCVIIDKTGRYSIGSQPIFELPPVFYKKILSGVELGKITDEFFGTKNAKKEIGAVGFLSKGLIVRKNLLKSAIKTALIPWISKEIYIQNP